MQENVESKTGQPSVQCESKTAANGWVTVGWVIFVLGVIIAAIGYSEATSYRPGPSAFIKLYAGLGLLPFGLLIACIGSVTREASKILHKLESLTQNVKSE